MDLYSPDAEKRILGSILIDPTKMLDCRNLNLNYLDFYDGRNQIIFKNMNILLDNNKPIEMLALKEHLVLTSQLNESMIMPYFVELFNSVPAVTNIDYFIKLVKDFSLKRMIKSELIKRTSSIATSTVDDMLTFCNSVKDIIMQNGELSDLYDNASTISLSRQRAMTIETGFAQLDSACGNGLELGTLTVLTGSPSSGKSTIINQIIAQAISSGFPSFIYSGELTNEMLMNWFSRTVANSEDILESSTSLGKYYNISEEGWEKIKLWLNDRLFVFSNNSAANEKNITNVIEYLAIKKNVKLFVIDNLMTLEFSGNDKYEKQIASVKAIKSLAKTYGLAIILIAHPNKSSLANKDPHVFDISGASEVPNLADYVFRITRGDDDKTEILIMKNRITGIQGKKFKFNFDAQRKRFFSRTKEELKRDYGYNACKEV